MKPTEIAISEDENGKVVVKINNIPHLIFHKSDLLGIYSYISQSYYYYIEITLKTHTAKLLAEYTKREVWEQVLALLENIK